MAVGDIAFKTPLADAFLQVSAILTILPSPTLHPSTQAGRRHGFPIKDINTGNATGFTFMQAAIKVYTSDFPKSSCQSIVNYFCLVTYAGNFKTKSPYQSWPGRMVRGRALAGPSSTPPWGEGGG